MKNLDIFSTFLFSRMFKETSSKKIYINLNLAILILAVCDLFQNTNNPSL